VDRERPLDAHAEADLADGERLLQATTLAPAAAAVAAVASVENESITTRSSTSGASSIRCVRSDRTMPATVTSSLRAGSTTLIVVPELSLQSSRSASRKSSAWNEARVAEREGSRRATPEPSLLRPA